MAEPAERIRKQHRQEMSSGRADHTLIVVITVHEEVTGWAYAKRVGIRPGKYSR
ncbi:hypothetical protein [Methanoregula sp.]|uniref:hypothetical protein n=1 Tax=Methanoregula sp. TaxID=2052170 RepID=UPI00260972FD|nr:hypothetical protein [Methanoregula sp.]MDD5142809.1 hypothetical protein [Methanoregula sp.]